MSDDSINIVRLDVVAGAEVDQSAAAVQELLRERGAIGQPKDGGWVTGPRATELLGEDLRDQYARYGTPQHEWAGRSHVMINREWLCHTAMGNFGPPACPRCGAEADVQDVMDGADLWFANREEPLLRCRACGAQALHGDWVGQVDLAFGAPSVTFRGWGWLDKAFMTDLEQVLGGRTRWVYTHV